MTEFTNNYTHEKAIMSKATEYILCAKHLNMRGMHDIETKELPAVVSAAKSNGTTWETLVEYVSSLANLGAAGNVRVTPAEIEVMMLSDTTLTGVRDMLRTSETPRVQ